MPVTTSNGDYFEDDFDRIHTEMFGGKGVYDKKTDTFTFDEDNKPEPKELYFVRHGDTDLNKEAEKGEASAPVRGWTDTPLNAQGRADAEKAAEKLHKEPITHIVTSDLPRASETASIIGDKLGITPQEHPGLRTWNLGEYTGKTGKDVHDAVDNLCLHQPDTVPAGGESFNQFKDRILTTVGQIAQDHAEHEVLVVSHNSPRGILDAYDQDTGKFDAKKYHSDSDDTPPGTHKKFTIKDPIELTRPKDQSKVSTDLSTQGMKMASPWTYFPNDNRTFEQRWEGMDDLDASNYLKGKQWMEQTYAEDARREAAKQLASKGVYKNAYTNQKDPTLSGFNELQIAPSIRDQKATALNASRLGSYYGNAESDSTQDRSEVKDRMRGMRDNYPSGYRPIADVENSIDSLAQKHGVEGSKMKDIITDVLKNPTDYISPMPGELGMAKGMNPGRDILRKLSEEGKSLAEIGKLYGVSSPSVLGWFKKFELPSPNVKSGPKVSAEDTEKLKKLVGTMSFQKIGKELGISTTAAFNRAREAGFLDEPVLDKSLSDWMKNQFEGAPTDPELIDSMQKYLTDKNTSQLRVAANENKPGGPNSFEDTHPLFNILTKMFGDPRSKEQQVYDAAVAKQKRKSQGFAGADRNQYPNTFKIKDADVSGELYKINTYLDTAREKWDFKKFGGEDVFKLEFAQKFKQKAELEDRMDRMPGDQESRTLSLKSLLDAAINPPADFKNELNKLNNTMLKQSQMTIEEVRAKREALKEVLSDQLTKELKDKFGNRFKKEQDDIIKKRLEELDDKPPKPKK